MMQGVNLSIVILVRNKSDDLTRMSSPEHRVSNTSSGFGFAQDYPVEEDIGGASFFGTYFSIGKPGLCHAKRSLMS